MTFDLRQYIALTTGVGLADVSDRTQIELVGADRVKFLNSFCTADIKRLAPGTGTEAFICNVKGKVLGHVFVYVGDSVLTLDTVPGQADVLIPHLDRYTLSDDVTLRDATGERRLLVVGGARDGAALQPLINVALPDRTFDFVESKLEGRKLLIARGSFIGPSSFTLRIAGDDAATIVEQLRAAGAVECEADVIDTCRIEAGMPLYGRDITDDNLPQEVNRNAQAISFTKGCYLGQETVARIDALGHVNRLLVAVRFFGEQVPAAGDELTIEGKAIGHVTSATFSPRWESPLALAYVRAAHAEPGSRLSSAGGEAEVIALP